MGLKITAKFGKDAVNDISSLLLKKIEEIIISRFRFVGETFVKNSRENHTYKDQTGNLTSSIGYVIAKDGEVIDGDFSGTFEGSKSGESFALEVAARFDKGYSLVCVAGMSYAAAVESKNYDVITSSSLIAENDLKDAIKEMKEKFGKLKK